MNLRARLLFMSITPVLVTAMLLTFFFLSSRLSRVDDELAERGQALVRQLAAASEFGLFSGNRTMLEGVAKAVLRDRDVAAVTIRGGDAENILSLGNPMAIAEFEGGSVSGRFLRVEARVDRPLTPLDDLFADSAQVSGKPLGQVSVIMSREGLAQVRQRILTVSLLVTGALVGVAMLLAQGFSRRISERVAELGLAVRRMGAGASDVRVPMRPEAAAELEALATGFNGMAEKIEDAQRGLQEKIEVATRELNDRRLDAERANHAKSRFLAAASHDLRQPLHALGLFADQLSRRSLPEEDGRLVGRIVESTEALAELLDALLDISRLDAGALTPQVRPFPLAPIFQRLQADFGEIAAARNLRFRVVESDRWVSSDPSMFERILINLVSNAIRYTERGTVLLAIRRRCGSLRIEVRDSGIGIPEAAQQLVFSEFVQLGNPERDRRKGLGLGLSIMQRMCKLLGHEYGLRSRPGQGSVFWFELPEATAGQAEPEMPATPTGDLAGCRVAVVEDDPLAREGLCGQLRDWGCEVHSAASGAELLVRLARHGARPDIIVSDQQLPNGEQGLLVIDQLRDRFGPDLPALLITGHPSRALQDAAADRGLPVLSKPVRPGKLRAVIRGLLARREEERAG